VRSILIVHDKSETRELELVEESYTLGRAKDNDIRLGVGTVSAHHAAIVLRDSEYWLQDLLSTNGSYVNGRRVQRRRLEDRDHIMLADCRMEFFEIIEQRPTGQRTKLYSGAMLGQATSKHNIGDTPVNRLRHRKGERGEIPYRSGRFFSADGSWFFATREGDSVGPFETLQLARAGLVEYGRKIGFLAGFDDDVYLR